MQHIVLGLVLSIVVLACGSKQSINYLGQTPPGDSARLFAEGLISTDEFEHSSPAFSPDGSVVLWTVVSRQYRASMWEMAFENGQWSKPRRPSFADSTADDYYPSFAPDGKKLQFSSRRKVPAGWTQGDDIRIWQVERTASGWGTPMPVDSVVSKSGDFGQSISANGTIVFSSMLGGATNMNIRSARLVNGKYQAPETLPFNVNSVGYEDGPCIAPDESFLIFESGRPGGVDDFIDLYISFKNEHDQWSTPVNMGPKINSASAERFAKLSPDGKYLFFGSNRGMTDKHWGFDIYWIDAKIIDDLKKGSEWSAIEQPLGSQIIDALFKNDAATAEGLMKDWLDRYSDDINASLIYSSNLRKLKKYNEAEQFLSGKSQWSDNTQMRIESALVKYGAGKDEDAVAILEPVLVTGPRQADNYRTVSDALLDMELYDKSDEYYYKSMDITPIGYPTFRRACRLAKIGETDRAFYALNKAVDYGLKNKDMYEGHEDLQALKNDKRWGTLVKRM